MLGKYLKVNGVQYPNPTDLQIKYKNNENVNLSEAYTELTSVNRLCKLELAMTFQLTSSRYASILADCKLPSVRLSLNGVNYVGRLRMASADLEENSETTQGTDGLWTVKVSFSER